MVLHTVAHPRIHPTKFIDGMTLIRARIVSMNTSRKKARTIGPESKPNRLAMLDGRTREAALVRKTRADLLKHLATPTVVQIALAERAAWLTLRINLLEARLAGTEAMSDHAARQYVALSNTLRRVLDGIGIQPGKPPTRSIAEIMAAQPHGAAGA